MFKINEQITFQNSKYIVLEIDNDTNTEPLITLGGKQGTFVVKESEIMQDIEERGFKL